MNWIGLVRSGMCEVRRLTITAGAILFASVSLAAESQEFTFGSKDALAKWSTAGDVSVDAARDRTGGTGSLRVAPGGSATLKLREEAGAGRVIFWIYDDGTSPKEPKQKATGPRWGLAQPDGTAVVVGHLYASYLSGENTYAASEAKRTAGPAEWLGSVQYLAVKRQPNSWQKWTFDFDAAKGLRLLQNDKPINRFDWNRTKTRGFNEVVILGDASKTGGQTIWVGSVNVEMGGQMKAQQAEAPAAAPVVPSADPQPTRKISVRPEVANAHPRVLFTKKDIPALRRRYQEDAVARRKLEQYVSGCKPFTETRFLKDATDGQRVGLWQMPSLAMHYILTDNVQSRDAAIEFLRRLVELKDWETTEELNSGMSAANIMIGAGMTYDLLYDQLPADLREKAAAKLLLQSRAMIHGGHLMKNKGVHYWQNDPANNHRWHRNGGLAMALLAVYEGQPEAQWAAEFLVKDLEFVQKWLPADGTNHEGPVYLIFGLPHLVLGMQASDQVLGTSFMQHDYFAQAPWFVFSTMRPGLKDFMPYGDAGGTGFYFGALYAGPTLRKDAAALVALDRLREAMPSAFTYGWMDLLWRDGSMAGKAAVPDLPKAGRYDDLGLTVVRDSWDDNAVAAMFKCGPLGGIQLNRYRESMKPFGYINVAHCDPDANTFIIAMGNELIAETDRYSAAKQSSSHNTLLINGTGQYAPGRSEGGVWSQPAVGDHSMINDARIVTWKQLDSKTLLIEGEAADSYPAARGKRPQIERFRRLFVWKEGQYILVLDDVRAPSPVEVTWLMQGPRLSATEGGAYQLQSSEARCIFQLVSDAALQPKIAVSTADQKKKPLGWQQLQATASAGTAVRFAAAFAPWGGTPKVSLVVKGERAEVTVQHAGGQDRWQWGFAADAASASSLQPQ